MRIRRNGFKYYSKTRALSIMTFKGNYIYNEEAELLSISLLCAGTEGTSPRVLIAMSFLLCINLARVSANDSISGA
jgi:hypothetical protein